MKLAKKVFLVKFFFSILQQAKIYRYFLIRENLFLERTPNHFEYHKEVKKKDEIDRTTRLDTNFF